MQVLSTIPVLFSYWARPQDTLDVSRFLNDHIADVVRRYPERFIGLGTVPMQSTEHAVKELERCHKIGLRGIEIGTNINDINLDEPQFFPIYETAEKLGMSIFVHPWNMMGSKNMDKYWLPWLVGMPAETSRCILLHDIWWRFREIQEPQGCFCTWWGIIPVYHRPDRAGI
jgi:aminocarboxymuconate-semialdehyde decarboxylase